MFQDGGGGPNVSAAVCTSSTPRRRQPLVLESTTALPSERVDLNRALLERMSPNNHRLVAVVAGKVVGLCGLAVGTGTPAHVGTLGIMVHEAYQDRGIGRALLASALDLADNHLGLLRVALAVRVSTPRAIHRYAQLGFVRDGCKRRACSRRGAYEEVLSIGRLR